MYLLCECKHVYLLMNITCFFCTKNRLTFSEFDIKKNITTVMVKNNSKNDEFL